MSELTSCNYCTLKAMRARAKRRHRAIKVVPSKSFVGGVDVLSCRRGNGLWRKVAWFWELGDRCSCGGGA